jgi:hypothetical protein
MDDENQEQEIAAPEPTTPVSEPAPDSAPEAEAEAEQERELEETEVEPEAEIEPEAEQEQEEEPEQEFDPSNFLPNTVTDAIKNSISEHSHTLLAQHQQQFAGLAEQVAAHKRQLEQLNAYANRLQNSNAFFKDGYRILQNNIDV